MSVPLPNLDDRRWADLVDEGRSLIPLGAVGAFHAATVAGLMFMGVARDEAAAATIVLHLFGFLPALCFGFYHLLRGELNLTRLRGIISGPKESHV